MPAAPQRLRERSERTRRCAASTMLRNAAMLPKTIRLRGNTTPNRPRRTLPPTPKLAGDAPMAALHDADLNAYSVSLENQQWFKDVVSQVFWRWYDANKDFVVTTISIWIIKKKIYVRDLHSLFVILFGPAPDGTTT